MITVTLDNGTKYEVKTLLGKGDSNAKLSKSDASGKGYLTFGLSLSPADTSGYQTCASSSPGCRAACLFTAGKGAFSTVINARIAKTKAYFEQRDAFLTMLRKELGVAQKKAEKNFQVAAVRLNVVSDIMWEDTGIIKEFPKIQFYDYTKHSKRMLKYCEGKLPENYHLTFSRSECNDTQSVLVLDRGGNVTVVFRTEKLPPSWCGYKVINGDETDLRFLDKKNSVVGLKAKGRGRKETSGFVINLL